VQKDRLDVRDAGFPRYMEAIRDLADLEFSLGSAREDNPLPMLARCGYVRPFFGESFRVDPGSPPPKVENRARARSILIRRHARALKRGSREQLRASWNHVALIEPGLEGNPPQTRIYDLSDPIRTGVPKARRIPVQLRLPAQLPRVALLLAESYGHVRERLEGQE